VPAAPRRLDVLGLLCPVPVLRSERVARRMAPGELLEVIGDDPLMRLDITAWCAREGHELLALESEGGRIRCLLRIGPGRGTSGRPGVAP
jgi:tRNA 2-thiouridine synthesizing protein A